MPLILDYREIEKLRRKKRPKRVRPIRPTATPERQFRKRIEQLWEKSVFPVIARFTEALRRDATPAELTEILDSGLRAAERDFGLLGRNVIDMWRVAVDRETREKLNGALKRSLGVDITAVLDTPEISQALELGGAEAASLIKTIPGEFLGAVQKAVADNFRGVPQPAGRNLLQQIQHLGGVSKKRAQVIARDQTAKMTSTLNHSRFQSIGVDKYIWRTSRDQRVVGNPSGWYPKGNSAHGNHYIMEGKIFSLTNPAVYAIRRSDGSLEWKKRTTEMSKTHPGMDIQCRCYAEPLLEVREILKHIEEA